MRIAISAMLAAAALAGCATAPVVDGSSALAGKDMATALSLYGRYDQKVMLEGRPHYIWRRAVVMNGDTYYCELRAETGFRDTIRSTIVEGYPAACSLFTVRYTNGYAPPRGEPGVAVATAATGVSANASARTR